MKIHTARRGAATLVVVMVLFFVMALVATYANRNLVVEQRIAANYQEVALATEMAIKGADTLLTLLNAPNVSAQCQVSSAGANTLRERLLSIDDAGKVSPHVPDNRLGDGQTDVMICDQPTEGDWACQCPLNDKPVGLPEASTRSSSARLRISATLPGTGHLELTSLGCAQGSQNCREAWDSGASDDSVAFYAQVKRKVRLVLVSALKMPPSSALVATGSLSLGGGMAAVNDDPSTGGIAIQHGLPATGALDQVRGPGGSGKDFAMLMNPALNSLSAEAFFQRSFGMGMDDYRQQAAVDRLDCNGDCAQTLRERIGAGAQVLWHDGDLSLASDATLGSKTRPIVLIVNGALRIQGALRIHGLVFAAGNAEWLSGSMGASWLNGALLVTGNWVSSAGVQLRHDSQVLNRLKVAAGTFVRAPGGAWSEQ
ncbi:MAG: PilX N-terminal domain-containing pilus assembly protein [Inhella sp.]